MTIYEAPVATTTASSHSLFFVQFIEVGRVASMQVNHKPVEKAMKGQDVCVKIDPVPGEAPKMYGRHFDHTDLLVSKVRTVFSRVQ